MIKNPRPLFSFSVACLPVFFFIPDNCIVCFTIGVVNGNVKQLPNAWPVQINI